jgi:hypothetical protein
MRANEVEDEAPELRFHSQGPLCVSPEVHAFATGEVIMRKIWQVSALASLLLVAPVTDFTASAIPASPRAVADGLPTPDIVLAQLGRGPRGGAAFRGPRGGVAVRGPRGGAAFRGPRGGVAVRGPNRVGGRYYGGVWYGAGVRRFYGGRWWPYGVGTCWRATPIGFVWVCG